MQIIVYLNPQHCLFQTKKLGMKKVILILSFIISLSGFAQSKKELSKWLDDYAICSCLIQYYGSNGIKTNDQSLRYWYENSLIDHFVLSKVGEFIGEYVKEINPNSAFDGTTPAINICLMIREDKDFLKIRKSVLNNTLKVD